METRDNKGRLSQKEMVEMVRSNIDLDQFEKEKELLNDLRSQYIKASKHTRKAKDEVRFLDKLNIFSDSPEEIKRNKAENVEDVYREKVTEKNSQIRQMIRDAIPPAIKACWLLKDLQNQLANTENFIGSALNEGKRLSDDLRKQQDQLSQLRQPKSGTQKLGPVGTVNLGGLYTHLQNSYEACSRASETYDLVLQYLKHTSKDPIQPISISLEELEDNMMK